ncbi:hypothetical protein HC928_08970, partial [bacterium]|nr:hypothetical protein [bacterium]
FFNYLTQQELQQQITVPLYADYQEGLLRQLLTDISLRYDRNSGTAAYDVPTLMTFSGSSGSQLDIDQAMTMIDAALRSPTGRTVQLPISNADSQPPQALPPFAT